jgi:DNA invertase Pin-like site-specific DNA recombinase
MRRGNEMNVVGYVRLSRDEDKENYSSKVCG